MQLNIFLTSYIMVHTTAIYLTQNQNNKNKEATSKISGYPWQRGYKLNTWNDCIIKEFKIPIEIMQNGCGCGQRFS